MSEQERPEDKSERWQRREKRRQSVRDQIQKHGGGLRTTYRDAILKRMRAKKRK